MKRGEKKIIERIFVLSIFLFSVFSSQLRQEDRGEGVGEEGIPIDWQLRIDSGNLLYAHSVDNILLPNIGNGYVSTFIGSNQLFVAGVFNGYLDVTPSHRASIPSPVNTNITSITSNMIIENVGYALDIEYATFTHRSVALLPSSQINRGNDENETPINPNYPIKNFVKNNIAYEVVANIEEVWFAHQTYRGLLVYQVSVDNLSTNQIQFQVENNFEYKNTTDFSFSQLSSNIEGVLLINGSIVQQETNYSQEIILSLCTPSLPVTITIPSSSYRTFYYLTTIRTNLDGDSQSPWLDVSVDYLTYQYEETRLYHFHVESWANLWRKGGISIGGNLYLSQVVNTSQYWILSSIRSDWEWGLSPGSLASNGYNGHSFWDTETWMYPHLLLLHPSLAKSVIQYRFNHRAGAVNKAKSYSPPYNGTMFPWESAFTGEEVCPEGVITCTNEQHISGDIIFALGQYYAATYDQDWLEKIGLPLSIGVAEFWQSRVLFNNSISKYAINDVCPPDEYHPDVNNSIYTNVVSSISFDFAIYASNLLGLPHPDLWLSISNNLQHPIDLEKEIHLEYDQYPLGTEIKQADVILLGFPLMYPMLNNFRVNDLNYYSEVTDPQGPAMTWAMTAIGYLEIGNSSLAESYFAEGYLNAQKPFLVWTETPTGGTVNFITGAGGFLQSVLFGYPSIRLHTQEMIFIGPVLPPDSTNVEIRNLDYLGNEFNYYYNETFAVITITTVNSPFYPLYISYPSLVEDQSNANDFYQYNESEKIYRKVKKNPLGNSWKYHHTHFDDDIYVEGKFSTFVQLVVNQPFYIPLPNSFAISGFDHSTQ